MIIYKYETLIQDLQSRLLQGDWKEGQHLPSIRQLAERYQCSKSTVIRAYTELERRHLIYAIPQSGYFVVKRESLEKDPVDQTIDFASAVPDSTLFPYRDFQHCLNQAIDRYKNELFTYGTPQGLPSLIQVLQKQLANYQVFARAEQFVITSGVQQALAILTNMPFPQKKEMILIEQPSYHLFIHLLELLNKPVVSIERTANGLDLDQVEHLFRTKPIKFFYTMARFHNPLGTSFSQNDKNALAELAKRYQVYIVEDDYLVDLEVDPKADPIYSIQQDYRIYLKSYSKIMFPGLRVGVTILPDELITVFNQYKTTQDIDSSMLSQAGLEIYIKNGMYKYHHEKIRAAYTTRMKKLHEVLESLHIDDYATYPSVKAGAHTHLLLKQPISINKLQERLSRKQITLGATSTNFLTTYPKKNLVRLNISNVPEGKIAEGVTLILQEIKRLSELHRRQFF